MALAAAFGEKSKEGFDPTIAQTQYGDAPGSYFLQVPNDPTALQDQSPTLVNGMSISGDNQDVRNEANAGAAARAGSGELSISAGASGAAEATRKAHLAAQNKDAEDQRNRLFLIQMMQLQDELKALASYHAAEAQKIANYFEDKFGDSWREELGLKVLDEDEMPQRKDGETLEKYRARVDEALIEKMIDPKTGKLKDEYKNHPDENIRKLGKYTEHRHTEREAKRMSKLTPQELDEYIHTEKGKNIKGLADEYVQTNQLSKETEVVVATKMDESRAEIKAVSGSELTNKF